MSTQPSYARLQEHIRELEAELLRLRTDYREVQATNTQLEQFIQHSLDPIVITDARGVIVKSNKAFTLMLGYPQQEIIGKQIHEFHATEKSYECTSGEQITITGDYLSAQSTAFNAFMKTGSIAGITSYYVNKDNQAVPAEQNIISLHDSQGTLSGSFAVIRDMSARLRAEMELKKSEERFRTFFELAPDTIFLSDLTGTFIDGNRAAEKLVGYSREELIGQNYFNLSLLSPEQFPLAMELLQKNVAGLPTGPDEFRLTKKDGETISVEISTFPIHLQGQDLVLGVTRDITERKQAEDRVRRARDFLEKIFNTIGEGVFVTDHEGTIVRGNKMLADMTGYTEDSLKGMHYASLYAKDICPDDSSPVMDRLLNEGFVQAVEAQYKRRDGSLFAAEVNLRSLKDSGDAITGAVAAVRDVSERKRAEAALKESEERFRVLATSAPDAIVAVDRNGTIVFWNEGARNMFGYTENEILGESASILISEENREADRAGFEKAKKEKKSFFSGRHFYGNGLRKDGTSFPDELSIGTWQTESGPYFIAVVRDITERKRAEEALKAAHDDLEIKVSERTQDLEEANTALRVLLKGRDEDKSALEEKVLFNVKELVEPYIEKLQSSGLNERQTAYLETLETNLKDIISPFLRGLSMKHLKLTPTETQVANHIRHGRRTKEIAERMNLGTKTVEFHRDNIRKKCGIQNKKINLRTFLESLS